MSNTVLDARLGSAAELVRQGAVFADIGTDHAHLPIFLLKEGRIDRAVCADINPGPLASAEKNVAECGFSDRVELVLTDGAAALADKGITDYAICGMGGELIADIIAAAPRLFDPEVRLILQPMSRQELLRSALAERGFDILAERYSLADGKYYVCILAAYSGNVRGIDPIEAYLGVCPEDTHAEYIGYLTSKLRSLDSAISGKRSAGIDAEAEEKIAAAIRERIGSFG